MLIKGVTLRGLEVFEALANSGSVAHAAEVTGLSQPAVSQQLRNLEAALGIDLVDHGRRPMRVTPAGRSFLARTEAVLAELRLAQSELTVMDLSYLSTLSIGLIDDFDNDLTPRLATALADSMTGDHPARPCLVLSNEAGAGGQATGIDGIDLDRGVSQGAFRGLAGHGGGRRRCATPAGRERRRADEGERE